MVLSNTRCVYALSDWTVEKRENGWYFSRTARRHNRDDWKGPYGSEASVSLMIARELRKEIARRLERDNAWRSA